MCKITCLGIAFSFFIAFADVEAKHHDIQIPTLENIIPTQLLTNATQFISSFGNSTLTSMVNEAIKSNQAGEIMRIFGRIVNGTMGVSEDVEVTRAQSILAELEKCVQPGGGTGTGGTGTGGNPDASAAGGIQRQGSRQQQSGGRTSRQQGTGRQGRNRNNNGRR